MPTLDGVVDKLKRGGRVADVGCGHGASTILMAQAFPASTFVGIDYHDSSIETARQRAKAAGVSNASFEVADATSYDGGRSRCLICADHAPHRRRLQLAA